MAFSLKAIIRAFAAPDHRINCRSAPWRKLTQELDRRGARKHEAGAFLLGTKSGDIRDVTEFVFYDELDPAAYSTGVCVLHAAAFSKLWTICREKALTVVADVHTHPGDAFQSHSDRTNPMVAREGHIAIIIPNFSAPPVDLTKVGIFEYRGSHEWHDRSASRVGRYLYTGFWS